MAACRRANRKASDGLSRLVCDKVFDMLQRSAHETRTAKSLVEYEASLNRGAASSGARRSRRFAARSSNGHERRFFRPRYVLLLLVLILGGGGYFLLTSGHGKFTLAALAGSTIKNLVVPAAPLKGQDSGQTNMLIYGMTKDGLRTDSVILMSYYWKQKKLVTLNIPRDLYIYDGYENAKMGEIYAYAVARKPHDSTYPDTFVASVIAKEYNIRIDYWTELNMQGEVDFVNAIGGIDINVPDSFTDYEYPTWNYSGYIRPAPHFNAGLQHMNGDTALIFSRSRHSLNNDEGTDFARSKRQALVIAAIMTKVKAMGLVGNLTDISKYLNILGNNITTSMSTDDMVSFAKTLKGISPTTDYVKAAWATGNGFLCDSTSTAGAYITLYGVPGSCTVGGGGYKDSKYREMALYFVKNLLTSAPMAPPDFVTAASTALGYAPATTPTPSSTSGE
jgi:LCP family protein required for cell wall assembly